MRGGSDNVIVVEVANVEIGKKKNVGFNTFKLIFDPNTKKLSFHKDGAYAAERTANTEGCSVSFVDDPRKKKKGGEKWPGQFRVDLIQKNQTDKKDDIKYIISITDDDIRNELIDALQPADESPYRQKEKVEADEAASPRRSGLLGRLGGAKGGKKQEGAKEESGGAAAPPAAEDADKLLIQAAKDGNVDEVSKQLADGADKNATSEDDGRSVAIHAVLSQKGEQATINCLKALHSKGADFDRGDNNSFTPLMAAAQKGEPAVVKWLLETGEADISKESGPGVTALSYAVSSKNKEVVRVLVAKKPLSNNEEFKKLITFLLDKFTIPVVGINEWKRDIFEEFDTDNNGEISIDEWEPLVADLTRKDESPQKDKDLALIGVAKKWDAKKVRNLLLNGAKPDVFDLNGQTATISVAARGPGGEGDPVKCLIELVRYGADFNKSNHKKSTPLMLAVEKKNESVVNWLLDNNADPMLKDVDDTNAAHLAATANYHECLQPLKTRGVDLDELNTTGYTPLMYAVTNAHLEAVRTLLGLGVKWDKQNPAGETALSLAKVTPKAVGNGILKLLQDKAGVDVTAPAAKKEAPATKKEAVADKKKAAGSGNNLSIEQVRQMIPEQLFKIWGTPTPVVTEGWIDDKFTKFDLDQDGFLNGDEWEKLLANLQLEKDNGDKKKAVAGKKKAAQAASAAVSSRTPRPKEALQPEKPRSPEPDKISPEEMRDMVIEKLAEIAEETRQKITEEDIEAILQTESDNGTVYLNQLINIVDLLVQQAEKETKDHQKKRVLAEKAVKKAAKEAEKETKKAEKEAAKEAEKADKSEDTTTPVKDKIAAVEAYLPSAALSFSDDKKMRSGFYPSFPLIASLGLGVGGTAVTGALGQSWGAAAGLGMLGTAAIYALQRSMQKSRKVLAKAVRGSKFYLRGAESKTSGENWWNIQVEESGSISGGNGVTITDENQIVDVCKKIHEKLKNTLRGRGGPDYHWYAMEDKPNALRYSVFLKTGTPSFGPTAKSAVGGGFIFHPEICITPCNQFGPESLCMDDDSLRDKKNDYYTLGDRLLSTNDNKRLTNGFVFLGYFLTDEVPEPGVDLNIIQTLNQSLCRKIVETELPAALVNHYNGYPIPGLRGQWGNDEYDYLGDTYEYCEGLTESDLGEYGDKLTNGTTIEGIIDKIDYSKKHFNCQHTCELMLSVLRCWPAKGEKIKLANGAYVSVFFKAFTSGDGQTNMNLDLHQGRRNKIEMEEEEEEGGTGDDGEGGKLDALGEALRAEPEARLKASIYKRGGESKISKETLESMSPDEAKLFVEAVELGIRKETLLGMDQAERAQLVQNKIDERLKVPIYERGASVGISKETLESMVSGEAELFVDGVEDGIPADTLLAMHPDERGLAVEKLLLAQAKESGWESLPFSPSLLQGKEQEGDPSGDADENTLGWWGRQKDNAMRKKAAREREALLKKQEKDAVEALRQEAVEEEKRAVLEKRLAHVRSQLPEELP